MGSFVCSASSSSSTPLPFLFFLSFCTIFASCQAQKLEQKSSLRKERLFFVSTSSTTSTIATTSICYVTETTGTIATCGRKKKRSIDSLTEENEGKDQDLSPTRLYDDDKVDFENNMEGEEMVESGMTDSKRQGKFLLYWATTTLSSTTTSYTATSTLGSLNCTPTSYSISQCGKKIIHDNRFALLFLFIFITM